MLVFDHAPHTQVYMLMPWLIQICYVAECVECVLRFFLRLRTTNILGHKRFNMWIEIEIGWFRHLLANWFRIKIKLCMQLSNRLKPITLWNRYLSLNVNRLFCYNQTELLVQDCIRPLLYFVLVIWFCLLGLSSATHTSFLFIHALITSIKNMCRYSLYEYY